MRFKLFSVSNTYIIEQTSTSLRYWLELWLYRQQEIRKGIGICLTKTCIYLIRKCLKINMHRYVITMTISRTLKIPFLFYYKYGNLNQIFDRTCYLKRAAKCIKTSNKVNLSITTKVCRGWTCSLIFHSAGLDYSRCK